MRERTKKIIYILLFFVIIFILAYILYFVFFRKVPTITLPETTTPVFTGGLPGEVISGEGGVGKFTPPSELPQTGFKIPQNQQLLQRGPTISLTGNGGIVVPTNLVKNNTNFISIANNGSMLNYYDTNTGLFNRIDKYGNNTLLSNRVFKNVNNVTWSPNDDQSVIEFNDGSNIIYNFANDKSFTLPIQYKDFSFSPDGSNIAAKDLKLNDEDKWLVVVDNEGKNKQLLEHLGGNESRVQVKWNPNKKIVATSAKSIDSNRAEIIFLTLNGEKLNKVTIQGRDLQYKYSPSGNRMAYSVYNADSKYLPLLWITSSNPLDIDSGRINTGLNTWADKCDFSNESIIYCAVPDDIGEFSGILKSNNDSDDSIYKINPSNGQVSLLAKLIFPVQIKNLKVTSDGSTLFYVDQSTGAIDKINL